VRLPLRVIVATLAVGVVLVGALTIGTAAGTASATVGCATQPCGTGTGASMSSSGKPAVPTPESCLQTTSCGGGGAPALAGAAWVWAAVLGGGTLALGLAPRLLRRTRARARRLPAGIPSSLLRPPQAI